MRLSELLPDVKITYIMISKDNHSELRLYNTSRGDMPENLQEVIVESVKRDIETAHRYGGMKNIEFVYGDEVLVDFSGYPVVFAHGHQYSRKDDILNEVEHQHNQFVAAYIGGHWHRYSIKYRDVKNGKQQCLIHLPSVVGDTDYSDSLHVSSLPGFCEVVIDSTLGTINAKAIIL